MRNMLFYPARSEMIIFMFAFACAFVSFRLKFTVSILILYIWITVLYICASSALLLSRALCRMKLCEIKKENHVCVSFAARVLLCGPDRTDLAIRPQYHRIYRTYVWHVNTTDLTQPELKWDFPTIFYFHFIVSISLSAIFFSVVVAVALTPYLSLFVLLHSFGTDGCYGFMVTANDNAKIKMKTIIIVAIQSK